MRQTIWTGLAYAGLLILTGCNGGSSGPTGGSTGTGGDTGITTGSTTSTTTGTGGTSSTTTGTGGSTGTTSGAPIQGKVKVGIVFDTGGLGDKSFNDSAWRGCQKAEKELGAEILKVESTKESDYANNLQSMADKGAIIVIGVGISMRTAIEQVAPNNPTVKFVSIDGEPLAMDNVRTIQFTEQEGSFLVGYLAGLVSKTHKLGFVGGMELPLIKKFQYGYAAGAKQANKATEILPAKYTGDWVNQDKAKVAADLLFGSGADIVYHAAGRAGLGVIASAKDKKKFAIGVDSDQDDLEPGRVLTSMIKHVDEGVFMTIRDLKDGKFTAGAVVYDLKAGGVGTSEFKYTKGIIGDENLKKLDAIKAKVISGEIKVPVDEATYNSFIAGLK
ncbi:MAG: BMP family ABC transporter substrate-binding protein [Armatimonadetes bacterium]|nr:BMP family ABC transporter substrate-binding protein [Armatimonadota bacterium]